METKPIFVKGENKLKTFKKIAVCAVLSVCVFSNIAQAKENFLNLGAVPAKADAELKAHMDKPFEEFLNVWMKDNRLAALNRVMRGEVTSFYAKNRKFYAGSETDFNNMVSDAVGTFKAYCEHHQGTVELLKSDIFCLLSQQPTAWMSWKHENDYAHFILDGRNAGHDAYLSKVTDVVPGNTIKTSYGNALVLEKGQNNLIKVQLTRGGERWISTDNITVRPH